MRGYSKSVHDIVRGCRDDSGPWASPSVPRSVSRSLWPAQSSRRATRSRARRADSCAGPAAAARTVTAARPICTATGMTHRPIWCAHARTHLCQQMPPAPMPRPMARTPAMMRRPMQRSTPRAMRRPDLTVIRRRTRPRDRRATLPHARLGHGALTRSATVHQAHHPVPGPAIAHRSRRPAATYQEPRCHCLRNALICQEVPRAAGPRQGPPQRAAVSDRPPNPRHSYDGRRPRCGRGASRTSRRPARTSGSSAMTPRRCLVA